MNDSLILEEVIREHKDKRLPLYIAFLDAKSAFDVVCHNSLMRKLFHIGVDGVDWSLIHSLHEGAESVVKWERAVSEKFQVWQGVRLGGILSTDLYKVYGNGFLDKLTVSGEGCNIDEISCVAPTVTGDSSDSIKPTSFTKDSVFLSWFQPDGEIPVTACEKSHFSHTESV